MRALARPTAQPRDPPTTQPPSRFTVGWLMLRRLTQMALPCSDGCLVAAQLAPAADPPALCGLGGATKEHDMSNKKEVKNEATGTTEPTRKEKRSAAETLAKYRVNYVKTDGYAGLSINNGDDIASALKMFEPNRVVAIAEAVLPGIKAGELAKRYAKLNLGMRRMNSGNRIRAALKKGTITKTALKKAIKANVTALAA